jgi:hypothetical protein
LIGVKETENLRKYLGEFFTILKSDPEYREKILTNVAVNFELMELQTFS